ncbi:hypothetical protein DY218_10960 [Streptomyces triticagri]|uniref:Uncharacterized protein n=1 Tax=Streptomyces triticagri TaxID=2293568 RepID=A0A372M848_9ACTN|nr:hypothetical protein [Streptomyces triticagri]RFU86685.1 hypothetical protein DY218_10960 [Streptomyces triticagri]
MVRWAAFSCVLVPVVLVIYGTGLLGTAEAALGLAAVTGVCRVLLRRCERGARSDAAGPAEGTPALPADPPSAGAVDLPRARRDRAHTGAHSSGRHSA